MNRIVPVLTSCWVCVAAAQTGQALIANPLLSPSKLKEVKRQIMEAGHQELAPKLAMPIATASIPGAPRAQIQYADGTGMQGSPMLSSAESIRRSLSSLRVMAIVGSSALLAPDLPQAPMANSQGPVSLGYPGSSFPNAVPMGMPPGMATQPGQQYGLPQNQLMQINSQQLRRGASTTVRNGKVSYVEGFEVTAFIEGDTVRLVMGATPSETIFQGQVQPAVYSPASDPRPGTLEKSSSEYLSNNKPETTALGNSNRAALANQMSGQNLPANSSSLDPSVSPSSSYSR